MGRERNIWSSGLVLVFTAVGSGFGQEFFRIGAAFHCCGIRIWTGLFRIFVAIHCHGIQITQKLFRIDCSLLLWHQSKQSVQITCSVCMKWKKILTQLYSDRLRHAYGGGVQNVLVYTGFSVTYWSNFRSISYG
jgi:hypothetical protein